MSESFERVCTIGIPYAECVGLDLKLDLYLPALAPESPPPAVVVYMHGGGWVAGIRSGPSGVSFALELSAAGLAVASIDYRLGPAHRAPAAIEDCKLAVRFLRSHAADLGIDGSRILAMGNSAGGHLAAMLGLTRPEDGFDGSGLEGVPSEVAGVIDIAGVSDITALLDGAVDHAWAALWLGGVGDSARELGARCSPLNYAKRNASPFLIIHGAEDPYVPVDQAQRLAAALRASGNECTFICLEKGGHVLGIPAPVDIQQRIREAWRAFARHLGLIPALRGSD